MISLKTFFKTTDTNAHVANNPQHNDIYIVEFPKSGITWFTIIIANICLISSGRKERANFSSIRQYIPDIHVIRDIATPIYSTPPVRFIKSHSERNENYPNVIYLARHPLDVMKSLYKFRLYRGIENDISFEAFCMSPEGIQSWMSHINSWLKPPAAGKFFHLIRYEDLEENPVIEVMNLINNLGWNISEQVVLESIALSQSDKMKESEETFRRYNPRYEGIFIKDENTIYASNELVSYINDVCEKELKLLRYAPSTRHFTPYD